jgi:quercetin dioxygenase-like cupin family protein
MRQAVWLTAGMLLGAVLANCARTPSALLPDPVKQSPQYYRVLVDNKRVRVLEYHLRPGEKEPMHSHPAGVVYYFSDAKFRTTFPDGRVTEPTATSGETIWREAVAHASENIGSTEAHALAVELKQPCR